MSAWRLEKLRTAGFGGSFSLPETIRHDAGIGPGACYVAIRALGPCVVICQIDDVTDTDRDAEQKLRRAMEAWALEVP